MKDMLGELVCFLFILVFVLSFVFIVAGLMRLLGILK